MVTGDPVDAEDWRAHPPGCCGTGLPYTRKVALVVALVDAHRALLPVLDAHTGWEDRIVHPVPFLATVAALGTGPVGDHPPLDDGVWDDIVAWLAAAVEAGDTDEIDAIARGFVGGLRDLGDVAAARLATLPPALARLGRGEATDEHTGTIGPEGGE